MRYTIHQFLVRVMILLSMSPVVSLAVDDIKRSDGQPHWPNTSAKTILSQPGLAEVNGLIKEKNYQGAHQLLARWQFVALMKSTSSMEIGLGFRNIADLYVLQNRHRDAIPYLKQAMEWMFADLINPREYMSTWVRLIEALLDSGRFQEAFNQFEEFKEWVYTNSLSISSADAYFESDKLFVIKIKMRLAENDFVTVQREVAWLLAESKNLSERRRNELTFLYRLASHCMQDVSNNDQVFSIPSGVAAQNSDLKSSYSCDHQW